MYVTFFVFIPLSYFADTLANQEASRHSGPLSASGGHADVVPTADPALMMNGSHLRGPTAVHHASGRIGNSSGYQQQQQHHGSNSGSVRTSGLGGQYGSRTTAAVHCGAFSTVS